MHEAHPRVYPCWRVGGTRRDKWGPTCTRFDLQFIYDDFRGLPYVYRRPQTSGEIYAAMPDKDGATLTRRDVKVYLKGNHNLESISNLTIHCTFRSSSPTGSPAGTSSTQRSSWASPTSTTSGTTATTDQASKAPISCRRAFPTSFRHQPDISKMKDLRHITVVSASLPKNAFKNKYHDPSSRPPAHLISVSDQGDLIVIVETHSHSLVKFLDSRDPADALTTIIERRLDVNGLEPGVHNVYRLGEHSAIVAETPCPNYEASHSLGFLCSRVHSGSTHGRTASFLLRSSYRLLVHPELITLFKKYPVANCNCRPLPAPAQELKAIVSADKAFLPGRLVDSGNPLKPGHVLPYCVFLQPSIPDLNAKTLTHCRSEVVTVQGYVVHRNEQGDLALQRAQLLLFGPDDHRRNLIEVLTAARKAVVLILKEGYLQRELFHCLCPASVYYCSTPTSHPD